MSTSEPHAGSGELSVNAPGARIRILDAYLQQVEGATAMDELTVRVPPGAYRVTARIGAREVSQAVLVRAGGQPREIWLQPEFDAAAPAYSTATANESHGELAWELTSGAPPTPGRLVIVLRGLRDRAMADLTAESFVATPSVRDQHGNVLAMPVPAEDPHHVRNPREQNRALGWAVDVPPGGCRVRWPVAEPEGTAQVEHALWIAPHAQTVLFVPQGPAGPVPAAASVHLLPVDAGWDAYAPRNLAVEATLAVLRSGSTRQRLDVWQRVLDDPSPPAMLGLLTLHEMVRSVGADLPDALRPGADRLLDHLRTTLGESPDVLALVATVAPSRLRGQVTWPPMLRTSHDLLLAAERSGADVIAEGSLAECVTGQMYGSAPWHVYDPTGLDGPAPRPVRPIRPMAPPSAAAPDSVGAEPSLAAPPPAAPAAPPPAPVIPAAAPPVPPTSSPAPSALAVDRVRGLVEQARSGPGGGLELESDEVAERLGMTPRLAESCLQWLQKH